MKIEYNVQSAVRRLERWRSLSSFAVAFDILVDKAESVFSKDAGEESSL